MRAEHDVILNGPPPIHVACRVGRLNGSDNVRMGIEYAILWGHDLSVFHPKSKIRYGVQLVKTF